MLKKTLYFYAVAIFSLTALQATDDLSDLSNHVEENTMVKRQGKGRCPYCPRQSSSSSSDANAFFASLDDDNNELNDETTRLFAVSEDEENKPELFDVSACGGKHHRHGRRHHRHHRNHKNTVACDDKEKTSAFFACNDDEEDVRILPA